MAKNFIEDLQKKLSPFLEKIPFLSKKNDEFEDDEEDEEDSDAQEDSAKSSIISEDKTNPKFDKTSKDIKIPKVESSDNSQTANEQEDEEVEDASEEDEEGEDEDEEEIEEGVKDQNKRKKIVQLLIALGAIYFIADEFMNPSSEEAVVAETPAVVQKKRPKKQNPAPVEQPVQEEVSPNNNQEKIEEAKEEVSNPPTEVVQESIQEPVNQEVPINDIAQIPETQMDVDVLKMDEIETESETLKEDPVVTNNETNENINTDVSQIKESETTTAEEMNLDNDNSLDSQLTNIIKSVEKDKVNKQYEYVAPPNYENFGESLVYNCKGKHWACVDKQAHFKCLYNYKWAKQNGKKPDCSNSKVLANGKDCRMLQLYNINMVVETPDCN